MSGNPFRRGNDSRPANDETPAEGPSAHVNPLRAKRKKKRVTIQTPPRSPEDPPRRPSLGRISPPPPLPPAIRNDDEESDSASDADLKLREASLNTRRNSDARPPLPGTTATGAPYNPFARTLATAEAQYGSGAGLQRGSTNEEEAPAQARGEGGNGAMDVDMFKNILLTGSAPPAQPASRSGAGGSTGDGHDSRAPDQSASSIGDNTEMKVVPDSFEDLESASEEEEEEEDSDDDNADSQNEQLNNRELVENLPPDAPRDTMAPSKPGRGPQVVSFDDFNESSQSNFQPSSTMEAINTASREPTAQTRDKTQNNIITASDPATVARQTSRLDQPQATDNPTPGRSGDATPKKEAPPPPASRRQAQAGRVRSTSDATENSVQEEASQHSKTEDKPLPVPPPPPSRKPRPVSHSPSPAPSTASTDLKAIPPPPPRRSANRPTETANSISSGASGARASPPQHLPPAPPPRRGGGAHKIATENTKASLTTASSSDMRNESISSDVAPSNASSDILADMSAFQAEIDALRARSHEDG